MNQPSSSTSSSDPRGSRRVRDVWLVSFWCILFLAIGDLGLNVLFPQPAKRDGESAGSLRIYFDYGRSIEGKIRRMVGRTDEETHPMALAGWFEAWEQLPTGPEADGPLIAVYGMSFSARVALILEQLAPAVTLRVISAPSAPLSHSYTAYQRDRDRHGADVVILGILASSLARVNSITHMTANFEAPAPHMYPRYSWSGEALTSIEPPLGSLEELRAALEDPSKWSAVVDAIEMNDDFYDPFLFNANLTDGSAIVRMIRRAWGQRNFHKVVRRFHDENGFRNDRGLVSTAEALVRDFAATARADARLPVVILFNDRGYGDHLYRALQRVLTDGQIPYVSTHRIAPAGDLSNFVPDGHFTRQVEEEIAEELLGVIRDHGLLR